MQKREHWLHIAVSKHSFVHSKHGIVTVRDPIRISDAKKYGLSPLLMYVVSVANLPIRWITFSPFHAPRTVASVLNEAWREAKGLRGKPESLVVNRSLAENRPYLAEDLAKIGVLLEITGTREKSHASSLRWAHDEALWLRKHHHQVFDDKEPVRSICEAAAIQHLENTRPDRHVTAAKEKIERIKEWMNLPFNHGGEIANGGLDWTTGPWTHGWEASLPPERGRFFYSQDDQRGFWLLSGENEDDELSDDSYDAAFLEAGIRNCIRLIIACWPNDFKAVAAEVGVSVRDIRWYIADKIDFDHLIENRLSGILGVFFDEQISAYSCRGPYVLIAREAKALAELYSDISHGGDARPWEILPNTGESDPSWRYYCINTFGSLPSIVMIPRGSEIADHVSDILFNFDGARGVSRKFYRDVVSTCAEACVKPLEHVEIMKRFWWRHIDERGCLRDIDNHDGSIGFL